LGRFFGNFLNFSGGEVTWTSQETRWTPPPSHEQESGPAPPQGQGDQRQEWQLEQEQIEQEQMEQKQMEQEQQQMEQELMEQEQMEQEQMEQEQLEQEQKQPEPEQELQAAEAACRPAPPRCSTKRPKPPGAGQQPCNAGRHGPSGHTESSGAWRHPRGRTADQQEPPADHEAE
jgi:hypothetical protein